MSALSPILGNDGTGNFTFNGTSLSAQVMMWDADYFQRLEDITTFNNEGTIIWGQCESYIRGTVGGLLMYGSGTELAAPNAIYTSGIGYGPTGNPEIYSGFMPPPQNVPLILTARTGCTISFVACFEHSRPGRRVNEIARFTADFVSQGPITITWQTT
jgi:hypothetical protein